MAKDKKTGLTSKQKYFAELYVTSGNATQSYAKAYNITYEKVDDKQYNRCKIESHKLLKNELVREYVAELTSQRSPLANENWIVDKLLEIVNNPNTKDADKLRAYDMLLKCLGAYTVNQNINANVNANVNVNPYENLTEEELKRLAEIEDDTDDKDE
jgi:phage terminase small subunit